MIDHICAVTAEEFILSDNKSSEKEVNSQAMENT